MSVSLSRGNIFPLMANQYFTEGISGIRDTQIQILRLDVCGSNPSRLASSSGKSILLPFSILFLFVRLISLIRDT